MRVASLLGPFPASPKTFASAGVAVRNRFDSAAPATVLGRVRENHFDVAQFVQDPLNAKWPVVGQQGLAASVEDQNECPPVQELCHDKPVHHQTVVAEKQVQLYVAAQTVATAVDGTASTAAAAPVVAVAVETAARIGEFVQVGRGRSFRDVAWEWKFRLSVNVTKQHHKEQCHQLQESFLGREWGKPVHIQHLF